MEEPINSSVKPVNEAAETQEVQTEETSTSDEIPTSDPKESDDSAELAVSDKAVEEKSEEKNENSSSVAADADDSTDDESEESIISEDEGHDELPDFIAMGTEELVKMAESLLKEKDISSLRPYMDGIRAVVEPRFDAVYKENQQLFLDQGGNIIDFQFSNPLRDSFRKTFQEYRSKRRSYYGLLEKQLEANLHAKNKLIDELKELLQKEESMNSSFKELKSIRDRWNEIGPVPKSESDNLWKTYHFHLDNFYDYVKINDSLRDLDFKKNKEAKEAICREAESLAQLDSINEAMSRLQELHKKWKLVGPVERELREPMWERFSAATHVLHEMRDAHREEMAKRDEERIAEKRVFLEKMENFSIEGLQKHSEWQKATEEMDALFDGFKKLGRINHPDNDALWQGAKQAYRMFIHHKNEHYRQVKKDHKENLERKEALVAKAVALKDSEDWRDTSNELKKLQAQWKEIGMTSRKDADRIWKEFRDACDHFFNRMKEERKDFKKKQQEVASAKKEVIAELDKLVADSEKLTKKLLLDTAKKYRSLGRLGRDFQKVDDHFETSLQKGFDSLKIGRQEAAQMQFAQKLDSMSKQGDDYGIQREQQNLRRQLDEAQKEVQQLENNIQFFRSSKGTNPMIQQVERKIEREKERVETLKAQMRALKKANQE